eukprot:TRINITY_DN2184_c1_g1_i1.p1 TRINITY_DN2184_c1_g1~~TRINITY_DN2184_c1_g1_i1.p1  ORF type:complete len:1122 (-),score=184.88 TRINITY_DN2184_c1_g1_i1:12-3377(-)
MMFAPSTDTNKMAALLTLPRPLCFLWRILNVQCARTPSNIRSCFVDEYMVIPTQRPSLSRGPAPASPSPALSDDDDVIGTMSPLSTSPRSPTTAGPSNSSSPSSVASVSTTQSPPTTAQSAAMKAARAMIWPILLDMVPVLCATHLSPMSATFATAAAATPAVREVPFTKNVNADGVVGSAEGLKRDDPSTPSYTHDAHGCVETLDLLLPTITLPSLANIVGGGWVMESDSDQDGSDRDPGCDAEDAAAASRIVYRRGVVELGSDDDDDDDDVDDAGHAKSSKLKATTTTEALRKQRARQQRQQEQKRRLDQQHHHLPSSHHSLMISSPVFSELPRIALKALRGYATLAARGTVISRTVRLSNSITTTLSPSLSSSPSGTTSSPLLLGLRTAALACRPAIVCPRSCDDIQLSAATVPSRGHHDRSGVQETCCYNPACPRGSLLRGMPRDTNADVDHCAEMRCCFVSHNDVRAVCAEALLLVSSIGDYVVMQQIPYAYLLITHHGDARVASALLQIARNTTLLPCEDEIESLFLLLSHKYTMISSDMEKFISTPVASRAALRSKPADGASSSSTAAKPTPASSEYMAFLRGVACKTARRALGGALSSSLSFNEAAMGAAATTLLAVFAQRSPSVIAQKLKVLFQESVKMIVGQNSNTNDSKNSRRDHAAEPPVNSLAIQSGIRLLELVGAKKLSVCLAPLVRLVQSCAVMPEWSSICVAGMSVLSSLGAQGSGCVRFLVSVLRVDNNGLRSAACDALKILSKAVPAEDLAQHSDLIISLLSDDDPLIKEATLQVVRYMGKPMALACARDVEPLLVHPYPIVRRACVRALETTGAHRHIAHAAALSNDDDVNVCATALKMLARFCVRERDIGMALIDTVYTQLCRAYFGAKAKVEALRVLGVLGELETNCVPPLKWMLLSGTPWVVAETFMVLQEFPKQTALLLPHLITQVRSRGLRRTMANLLTQWQRHFPLAPVLLLPRPTQSSSAAAAAPGVPSFGARAHAYGDFVKQLVLMQKNKDSHVRLCAVSALTHLCSADLSCLETVASSLLDEDPQVQHCALNSLADIIQNEPRLFPITHHLLARFLRDTRSSSSELDLGFWTTLSLAWGVLLDNRELNSMVAV